MTKGAKSKAWHEQEPNRRGRLETIPKIDTTDRRAPADLFPGGRIRMSLRTRVHDDAMAYAKTLDALRDEGEWELIRAIVDDVYGIHEVHEELRGRGSRALKIARLLERAGKDGPGRCPTYREEREAYIERLKAAGAPHTSISVKKPALKGIGAYRVFLEGKTRIEGGETREQAREARGTPIDDLQMDSILPSWLDAAITATGHAPSTQEGYRIAASGLFTTFIEVEDERRRLGHTPRLTPDDHPVRAIEPRDRFPRIRTLGQREVRAVLEAAVLEIAVVFLWLVELGLRIDELCHLRVSALQRYRVEGGVPVPDPEGPVWRVKIVPHDPEGKDIDLDDPTVCGCQHCRSSRGWIPKGTSKDPRKNNSIRILEIPEHRVLLRALTERYLALYPAPRGGFLFRNPNVDLAFPERRDRPWRKRALRNHLKAASEAAGVPYGRGVQGGWTPHDLRHTCATELLRAGVRESVVARILGDTVQTVVNTYINLDLIDAAKGLAALPSWGGRNGYPVDEEGEDE